MSVLPVAGGDREEERRTLRVLYSADELNRAYARAEAVYNCLVSNWEWFRSGCCEAEPGLEVELRVEQN